MKASDYIVFILSHGRADNVVTYDTLKRSGYTGRVGIVIDDEDTQGDEYRKNFGAENVYTFNKAEIAETFDEMHKADRRTVVYARNACFKIAEAIGVKYFIELDDDYNEFKFVYRGDRTYGYPRRGIKDLDVVFSLVWDFYLSIPAKSIAFCQGGDFIGGAGNSFGKAITLKRKCMNSFFCSTDRPFQFIGRINEDVNTYVLLGHRGDLFFTFTQLFLNQLTTQKNAGGMSDVYLASGTYVKTFFSVMCVPSAVSISMMGGGLGVRHLRIHHKVSWNNCAPKIVRESLRKGIQG